LLDIVFSRCLLLTPFVPSAFQIIQSNSGAAQHCWIPRGQEALQSSIIVLSSIPKLTIMKYVETYT